MYSKKEILIAFSLLCMLFFTAEPAFSAANQTDCEALATYVAGLTDNALQQPITNVTATWYPAAAPMPEYCDVRGRMFPEIDFRVLLPSAWQGRSLHVGGGAWDGSIPSNPSNTTWANVLTLGYAGSASNGGHNSSPLSGTFGLKDPYFQQMLYPTDPAKTNPYSCQKIVDFGNRALTETPLVARKIIQQYYGQLPNHYYYSGASTGGREGLVEAQKNYNLFDGLYIAYPTGGHIPVCTRGLWDSVQGAGLNAVFSTKAIALQSAVYGKCDGVDGLVDGVIDDPRNCNFDHLTDLPACPNDQDAAGCFTLAQRQALQEIYRGPHNSNGEIYVGTPLSAEYLTDPANPASSGFGAALLDALMFDLFRYIVFDPPKGPTWDMMTFNWETDPQVIKNSTCTQCYGSNCKTYKLTDELDAVTFSPDVAPNMGGFAPLKNKGGKIIHYGGWADGLVSSLTSVKLYESVLASMGDTETKSFWKLYMVPGMGHGTPGVGGPQTWNDGMGALVNWVENNVEPGALIGTRAANAAWGWPVRTRPLCPYPGVARYLGTGSIDDAANFTCAEIIPAADVRIIPARVSLSRTRRFAVVIRLPDGYKMRDLEDTTVVCEGAPATRGFPLGQTRGIAWFNMEDLINPIASGDGVTFRVSFIAQYNGQTVAFEGSDTIKVIE